MNMLMMLLIGLKKMCCQKVFKFMDINKFGKTSYLYLTAELKDNKTLLTDIKFSAPYKIMLWSPL